MSALTRSASRIAAMGVSTAPTTRRTRRAHRGARDGLARGWCGRFSHGLLDTSWSRAGEGRITQRHKDTTLYRLRPWCLGAFVLFLAFRTTARAPGC